MDEITIGQCNRRESDLEINNKGDITLISRLFISNYERKILLGLGDSVPERYRESRRDILSRLARRMDRLAREYERLAEKCND